MANAQIQEVEMQLIASLVTQPEHWDSPELIQDLGALKPQHFQDSKLANIFAFYKQAKRQLGTTKLDAVLANFDRIDLGGKKPGFTNRDLAELMAHPSGGYLPTDAAKDYIKAVIRDYQVRCAGQIFQTAAAQAFDQNGKFKLEDIVQNAEAKLSALVGSKAIEEDGCVDVRKAMLDYLTSLQNRIGQASPAVMSGFAQLDSVTGGFLPGSLIVLGARPGIGKTTLALNIAENVARDARVKHPVLMVSLEMPREQLVARIMSRAGMVSTYEINNNLVPNAKWTRILQAIKGLHLDGIEDTAENVSMYLCDRTSISAADIRNIAQAIAMRHGGVGMIVVDYIQLLKPVRPLQSRVYEVGEASRELKTLALELKCPVLALAQLNRNIEHRTDQSPTNADLRDSGSLEQDADVVMLLARDAAAESCFTPEPFANEPCETDATTLKVSKNRHGALSDIPLALWGRCSLFLERQTPKSTPSEGNSYVAY